MYGTTTKTIEGEYDTGLRSYLTLIYNWMLLGLLVSAGSAYLSNASGLATVMAAGGFLFWVALLVPFGLIFVMAAQTAGSGSVKALGATFLTFAAIEGLSLSVILKAYTSANVTLALVATAATFAGMSLYGYTTKRDLSGFGSFIVMALVGLIVTMIIGMVLQSTFFTLLVCGAGVLIFSGLVAYDTQEMKANYVPGATDRNARMAVWHALDLYLDFLNLFLYILRIVGIVSSDD